MDTDSLLQHRIASLMKQPDTIRGKTIMWYASLNNQPGTRIVLFMLFVIFVLVHLIAFVCMLKIEYEVKNSVSHIQTVDKSLTFRFSLFKQTCPLFLLIMYPIIFIPVIITLMIVDIRKRSEGLLVWHRDSIGELVGKWFMTLLILISFSVFYHCRATTKELTGQCVGKSLIPLLFPLFCISCKVVCLKNQRMIFWIGFLICLTTQLVVLEAFNIKFRPPKGEPEETGPRIYLDAWLAFVPIMVFGILVDIECLLQTKIYKPKAFKQAPQHAQTVLMAVGLLSLCASIFLIIFSFFAFSPLVPIKKFVFLFFDCIAIKAVCWSPFIAADFYDTVFENIYVDVNFYLNPINPRQMVKLPNNKSQTAKWNDDDESTASKPQFGLPIPRKVSGTEENPIIDDVSSEEIEERELNLTEMEQVMAEKQTTRGNESILDSYSVENLKIANEQKSENLQNKNELEPIQENEEQRDSVGSLNHTQKSLEQ